jgi:hypothetical protein
MTTLFIIGPDHKGDGVYSLVADTGECLADHYCSASYFAPGDLEADRPERQKDWKEKFGEYKVLFIGEQSEITLEELLRRNKEWFNSLPKEEKPSGLLEEMGEIFKPDNKETETF